MASAAFLAHRDRCPEYVKYKRKCPSLARLPGRPWQQPSQKQRFELLPLLLGCVLCQYHWLPQDRQCAGWVQQVDRAKLHLRDIPHYQWRHSLHIDLLEIKYTFQKWEHMYIFFLKNKTSVFLTLACLTKRQFGPFCTCSRTMYLFTARCPVCKCSNTAISSLPKLAVRWRMCLLSSNWSYCMDRQCHASCEKNTSFIMCLQG